MPRLKKKYDHVKVYRPDGARYAEGICEWPLRTQTPFPIVTSWTIAYAIDLAMKAYIDEFGGPPRQEDMVVEVSCTRAAAYASIYSIGIPSDD